jgi:hypothetical protein
LDHLFEAGSLSAELLERFHKVLLSSSVLPLEELYRQCDEVLFFRLLLNAFRTKTKSSIIHKKKRRNKKKGGRVGYMSRILPLGTEELNQKRE